MTLAKAIPFLLGDDYEIIRQLSISSRVYLCRERASGRLLVIKKFTQAYKNLFLTELATLENISKWQIAPRCFFAVQRNEFFFLGMEYCNGKNLLEGKDSWLHAEKKSIVEELQNILNLLHNEARYAHLDLSPNNILVQMLSNGPKIFFLDWELACPLTSNYLNNFTPRGTPGYMTNDCNLSLQEKDVLAIISCNKFLGIEKVTLVEDKMRWLPWT